MDLSILKKSGSTYTDYSNLRDYYGSSQTVSLASTEYLYIGSPFKFNQFYFKLSTPTNAGATLNVQLWDGTAFNSVAYTQDKTTGLSSSGIIFFIPDKEKSWTYCDSDQIDSNMPTLYDLYWARIGFSQTLSPDPVFSYIGHLYLESDSILYGEFPIFNSSTLKSAYQAGKTDWEEQRYIATQLTIEALIQKALLNNGNQLLDISRIRPAVISKTAQIIFSALGDDYKDDVIRAEGEFHKRIHSNIFYIDSKNTATIDNEIRAIRSGVLYR